MQSENGNLAEAPAELLLVRKVLAEESNAYLTCKTLDPSEGVDTLAAYYHFYERESAEEFYELERIHKLLEKVANAVTADPKANWSAETLETATKYQRYRVLLTDFESFLLRKFRCQELFAHGLDNRRPINEPICPIDRARWETLELNVNLSMATQPGLTITAIRIFDLEIGPSRKTQLKNNIPRAKLRGWLRNFISDREETGQTCSQTICYEQACKTFGMEKISREDIRSICKELKPKGFRRGRRKNSRIGQRDTSDASDGKD